MARGSLSAVRKRPVAKPDPIGCAHCEDQPAPTGARVRGWFTGVAAVLVAAACGIGWFTPFPAWSAPVFIAATIVGSAFPAQRAWQSIKRGALDINVLMVVAVVGAIAIRQFEEAAMVVSLFAAAQWLEAQSLDRARKAIGRLLDLASTEVLVRDDRGERRLDIEQVDPGALMIVKPGEKIALDGIVRTGRSDVNQAPITGESLPVEKLEGDEVFAGTINGHGALTVAVTRRRADSTLARIVHLVESAQAKRAPMQQFIDRFAAWYTPSVVILALAVASVPVLAFGQPFEVWLYRALVLLVVACPCALVISTPVSIVSALAGAARQGVLVKGGIHLERLAGVRVVAFDKTGTVTTGRLTLDALHPVDGGNADTLLGLAASVESQSEHPIASAILAAARARGITPIAPVNVRALPGLGVEGHVGGARIVCGTPRLFAERGVMTPAIAALAGRVVKDGMSPIVVARDGVAIGVLGVTDRPKAGAARVVSDLRAQGVARIAMITGDHDAAAQATGSAARRGLRALRTAASRQGHGGRKLAARAWCGRDGRRRRQRRAGVGGGRRRHRDGRDGQRRRARDRRHRADDRRIAESALHDSPEPRHDGQHPRERGALDRAQSRFCVPGGGGSRNVVDGSPRGHRGIRAGGRQRVTVASLYLGLEFDRTEEVASRN